jgi:probable HAF family extracellular repeat protein
VNLSPSAYTDSNAAAAAINNSGQIVGYSYFNGGVPMAALWSNGTATKLGVLPGGDDGSTSYALAINNHGAIVGQSDNGTRYTQAVLFAGGTIKDLNSYLPASLVSAKWQLIAATGINDSGEIVGNAYNSATNEFAAFAATPLVPVPSISSIQPNSSDAGSAAFILTVNGSKFVSGDTVEWNGVPLVTTYVSATKLSAKVTGAEVATAGSAAVTVVDTAADNVTSNAALFTIPLTSIVITSQSIKTISGGYSITLSLRNSGFKTVLDVALTGAYLATSSTSSSLPVDIVIASNGTKTVTLDFPSAVGKAGEKEFLLLYGSYTGGGISLNSSETLP